MPKSHEPFLNISRERLKAVVDTEEIIKGSSKVQRHGRLRTRFGGERRLLVRHLNWMEYYNVLCSWSISRVVVLNRHVRQ